MWGSGLGYWGSAFFFLFFLLCGVFHGKKLSPSHRVGRRWHRFWLEKQDGGLISSQRRSKINKPLRFQDMADSHYLCLYDIATGVWKFQHKVIEPAFHKGFGNAVSSVLFTQQQQKVLGVEQWHREIWEHVIRTSLSHTHITLHLLIYILAVPSRLLPRPLRCFCE